MDLCIRIHHYRGGYYNGETVTPCNIQCNMFIITVERIR